MYPLKMKPIYYEKIWGGKAFSKFRNDVPDTMIGEAWDIACHPNAVSEISNGPLKGKKLTDILNKAPEKFLGAKVLELNHKHNYSRVFPLLVKLINTLQPLSVQVHPTDLYNLERTGEPGKTECWYVMDAQENSELIIGIADGINGDKFISLTKKGKLEPYLKRVKVKSGDFFFIPSGLIHAIGKGLVIVEIQQNSDTTFRVYDYERERELHIDQAAEVIDFQLKPSRIQGAIVEKTGYCERKLVTCDYFSVIEIDVHQQYFLHFDEERFSIITNVKGCGVIKHHLWKGPIGKGDSFMIPTNCRDVILEGNMTLLLSRPYPMGNRKSTSETIQEYSLGMV